MAWSCGRLRFFKKSPRYPSILAPPYFLNLTGCFGPIPLVRHLGSQLLRAPCDFSSIRSGSGGDARARRGRGGSTGIVSGHQGVSTGRAVSSASSARFWIARRVSSTIRVHPKTRPATPTVPERSPRRTMKLKARCRLEAPRLRCPRLGSPKTLRMLLFFADEGKTVALEGVVAGVYRAV